MREVLLNTCISPFEISRKKKRKREWRVVWCAYVRNLSQENHVLHAGGLWCRFVIRHLAVLLLQLLPLVTPSSTLDLFSKSWVSQIFLPFFCDSSSDDELKLKRNGGYSFAGKERRVCTGVCARSFVRPQYRNTSCLFGTLVWVCIECPTVSSRHSTWHLLLLLAVQT